MIISCAIFAGWLAGINAAAHRWPLAGICLLLALGMLALQAACR